MSGQVFLRGGRVLDAPSGYDRVADVLVEAGQAGQAGQAGAPGRILRVGPGLAPPPSARVVDARDKLVSAGFIDLHTHLREPGQEYKEDIESGTRAAVAGGFTTVCCMANTVPPNDTRAVTDLIVRRAREVGACRVLPIGAVSQGLRGEALAEMADMKQAGIVAVSDDGRPVMSAGLMRRALEYARTFGLPVVQHAEDLSLSDGGVMNEGLEATRAGLRGQPPAAESVMVARDLELVAWTGARYHVAHMSVGRSAALVRDARRRGLPVTCEVAPHHLALTDAACGCYDTNTKVAPPLRTASDVGALEEALADGTVDAIATDHAPHSAAEKELEFDHAAFGMIGLELAFSLVWALVRREVLSERRAIELLTSGPASCFGLDGGRLVEGARADVTVLDPGRAWTPGRGELFSRSTNTPFLGKELRGRAVVTLVAGRVVHDLDGALA